MGRRLDRFQQHDIVTMAEPQNDARTLVEKVAIHRFRPQHGHPTIPINAHCLEAIQLGLQRHGFRAQGLLGLQTAITVMGMMDEKRGDAPAIA